MCVWEVSRYGHSRLPIQPTNPVLPQRPSRTKTSPFLLNEEIAECELERSGPPLAIEGPAKRPKSKPQCRPGYGMEFVSFGLPRLRLSADFIKKHVSEDAFLLMPSCIINSGQVHRHLLRDLFSWLSRHRVRVLSLQRQKQHALNFCRRPVAVLGITAVVVSSLPRSSRITLRKVAPMCSSTRSSLAAPGIRTICGFCASSQTTAI